MEASNVEPQAVPTPKPTAPKTPDVAPDADASAATGPETPSKTPASEPKVPTDEPTPKSPFVGPADRAPMDLPTKDSGPAGDPPATSSPPRAGGAHAPLAPT
jgi:hypothetical protein